MNIEVPKDRATLGQQLKRWWMWYIDLWTDLDGWKRFAFYITVGCCVPHHKSIIIGGGVV